MDKYLITKSILLSHKTEEEYFYMYLGIIPEKNKLYKSQFRKDRRPTCSFFRSKSGLFFRDFGINKTYSFVDVVMEKYNLSYYQAIRMIAKDIGLIDDVLYIPKVVAPIKNIEKIDQSSSCILEVTIKEYSEEELKWWSKYNIDLSLLNFFNVYSLKAVFINSKLNAISTKSNIMFGYFFGKKHNLDLWKIYFPNRKSYRFLLNNNEVQGLKQLEGVKDDFVVITKSYKDVICLRSFGIYAVAPQSECVLMDEKLINNLKENFKTIIFNADWDRTGQSFMIKNRKKYGGLCLAFSDRKKWKKDFSDNVAEFGFSKMNNLIKIIKHASTSIKD